ncbi:MAG: hypothetical protein ABFD90_02595 [Phycisphaerales bacterium]
MAKSTAKRLAAWEKTRDLNAELSELLGVSVRTFQEWEQGRKVPSGAAATLPRVAARHPEALHGLVA